MKLPKELREKKELSGTVKKSKKCSIDDCSELAIRSLSENKWGNIVKKKLKLKYEENRLHKIFLCKKHYKAANKIRKDDEKLIQKKGFLENDKKIKKGKSWD